MHIKNNRIMVILAYLNSRVIEQSEDNMERDDSKSIGTHIGVDYHMVRKEVADLLYGEIHEFKHNGVSISYLSETGKLLLAELLETGVRQPTIISWLKKYKKFDRTLYTTF